MTIYIYIYMTIYIYIVFELFFLFFFFYTQFDLRCRIVRGSVILSVPPSPSHYYSHLVGTGQTRPCPAKCANASETIVRHTVKAGSTVELQGEAAIQQAIMTNGPVEVLILLFYNYFIIIIICV